jgi:uncharacterized protein
VTLRRAASWLLLALVVGGAPASAKERFPRFSAPLVDAAGVVDDDAEQRIIAELIDYQRRSGNQIAVAVIETYGDASLEDYTIDLAREWGVGTKDKDNGVLLLVAMEERDIRIEVGRGLEGDLTDLESGRIIRNTIAPLMREGDVGVALEAATVAIRRTLGDPEAGEAPVSEPEERDGGSWFPILGFLPLFFIFSALSRRGRRRRRWDLAPILWGGTLGGGTSGGGFGGSSGGGFGGGGGGGFGGGGASGGW